MPILRLALPTPLRCLFDYLPPADIGSDELTHLLPGCRLSVPFGKRELTGYLVEIVEQSEVGTDQLKHAIAVLDATPLVESSLLDLCAWAARYYHHPPGEVFLAAFPQKLRQGEPAPALGEPHWALTSEGMGLPEGALKRSARQASALALLQSSNALAEKALLDAGISKAVLRSMRDKALVARELLLPPTEPPTTNTSLTLNAAQQTVLEPLTAALGSFSAHLLEGVTGSGKTEVYLQWIAAALARGQQALVLIPEIGLTPQTVARFETRFNATIVVLHSGVTPTQRLAAWQSAASGRADIVIGTRSAVFTPMPRLGLTIVDEEHDGSYKQQDGFRYSARDVAIKRAQLTSTPILLGSATPALESLHNALLGRYQHHRLPARAGASTLPELQAIDLRKQPLEAGLSPALVSAVERTLTAGKQVLLFLNRRGFAPSLQCHDCGWVAQCKSCDARFTVHRRQRQLRCHHCGAKTGLPERCGDCHSGHLLTYGLGTEQAEDFLTGRFQAWPIERVDSDTMQSRTAMSELVDRVNTGQPCILLGTQMLTKGHHFTGVGLVGVIDADALMFSPDFRGEERMAQLLTQVAGRAGRGTTPGRVLLQTHHPDHPALQAMLIDSYHDRAKALLSQREATGMPPFGHLLILRCDSVNAQAGEAFLANVRRLTAPAVPKNVSMLGPFPSAMPRRAGRYRLQLLARAGSRAAIQQVAQELVWHAQQQKSSGNLKWSIDIDPLEIL
ncbi:MAG: primosomal protein N' [Halioglobus sp.]